MHCRRAGCFFCLGSNVRVDRSLLASKAVGRAANGPTGAYLFRILIFFSEGS